MALLAAGVFLGILHHAALPVLRQAIDQLPDQGSIVNRLLVSPLTNTTVLAQSSMLAIAVDSPGRGHAGLRSDFRVWFRARELAVCSVFGCTAFRYSQNSTMAFNRKEILPALDAWIPVADAALALVFVGGLFVAWTLLASLFFPIPMLVARYSDRALPLRSSWKLSGAALMPGALLATAGLAVYGAGWISLTAWLVVAVLHLMVGWLYLVLAPLSLPRRETLEKALNPFTAPALPTQEEPPKSRNPFTSP